MIRETICIAEKLEYVEFAVTRGRSHFEHKIGGYSITSNVNGQLKFPFHFASLR